MKKIALLLILITLFKSQEVSAQTEPTDQVFQATFDTAGNTVTFYIRPTQTISTEISYMQFSIGFPTASTPPFTVSAITSNTTEFPGLVMDSNIATYALNGYTYYTYTNNVGTIIPTPPGTTTYTAGTAYPVFTLTLSGTTANFVLASDSTLEVASTGASYDFVMYNGSANLISAPSGTELYSTNSLITSGTSIFAPLADVTLPVSFVTFVATLQNDNADLTWTVANQTAATKYYAVQKSTDNGLTFSTIDTVLAINSNATSNTYSYTDTSLSLVKSASNTIYYRIQQVDGNGTYLYSPTDIIRLPAQADPTVTVYPNPAQDVATVKFYMDAAAPVTINLIDVSGKILQNIQLQGTIGENLDPVNTSSLVSGNYVLSVNIGGVTHVLPVTKANY